MSGPILYIGFSGHRDCVTTVEDLGRIAYLYPMATWVHGGAKGFDTQVHEYATTRGLPVPRVKRPNYDRYPPKIAPIMRNHEIVDVCDLLIVCWDGRREGGTYDTMKYAQKIGRAVLRVECVPVAVNRARHDPLR